MRKILFRLTILFFLFLQVGFIFSAQARAQEYTVKSAIIVPPQWQGKLDKATLENYKSGIINGLNAVRILYGNLLSGKTFKFDRSIEVVASKDPIEKVEEKIMLERDYRSSFYSNVFPERKGVVYIAWGIGTKNGARRGDAVSKDFGFVWLKHQDILGLSADGTEAERKWSLAMVAHELGHAFGLVFAGYADGHPCTSESPQECLPNAPRPYPETYEWASIMGYGTPYLSFPNLFFNNSIYNPEIQKILKSPFINPTGDPAPSPTSSQGGQKLKDPLFFELVPGSIIAGQNFAIKGVNLESFDKLEIRQKDLSNPSAKELLKNPKILDNNGSTIRINVAEDAVSPDSDSNWEIRLLNNKGISLTVPIELNIKGKNASSGTILSANITTTCGSEKKPVEAASIRLQTRSGTTLSALNTQPDGTAILNYTIQDAEAGGEYDIVADEIQGILPSSQDPGPAGANSKAVNGSILGQSFTTSATFNYSECPKVCNPKVTFLCGGTGEATSFPKGHTVKITPNCSNTNLYGEGIENKEDLGNRGECGEGIIVPDVSSVPEDGKPKVSSRGAADEPLSGQSSDVMSPEGDYYAPLTTETVAKGTKIQISNDYLFRDHEGDLGSPTITVEPGSNVTWTLSTLGNKERRQVAVKLIENGVAKEPEPLEMKDGDVAEYAGVKIKAQTIKNYITEMKVNVNGNEQKVDPNSEAGLAVQLKVTPGQPKDFDTTYTIYYADQDEPKTGTLKILYRPPRDCECPYEQLCTTADGSPGKKVCEGVKGAAPDGVGCGFDQSGGCNPDCDWKTCEPLGPPVNYCEEAGFVECNPQETGQCDLNGQKCTEKWNYECNFGGKNYCNPEKVCGEPCESTGIKDPSECGNPGGTITQCGAWAGACSNHPEEIPYSYTVTATPRFEIENGQCKLVYNCQQGGQEPNTCDNPPVQEQPCLPPPGGGNECYSEMNRDNCAKWSGTPSDDVSTEVVNVIPRAEVINNQCNSFYECEYQGHQNGVCGYTEPTPDCGTPQWHHNECVGCNTSKEVLWDSCNVPSWGKIQDDPACSGPEWCPATQECEPYSPGEACTMPWGTCTDGSVCATGTKYCLPDGSGWGECQEEYNSCGTQCAAPEPKDCGTPDPYYEECASDVNTDVCPINEPYQMDEVIGITPKFDENCVQYLTCKRVGPIPGRCNYYPEPGGAPAAPSYGTNESCIDSGYNGSGFFFTWNNESPEVSYIDISEDEAFGSFYNKGVSGLTSTEAPSGFTSYPDGSVPLTFIPNKTYYVRIYNGAHSSTVSFTTPASCTGDTTPPPAQDCPDGEPYCDDTTQQMIQKYGGYRDEATGECIWNYDILGPC